MQLEPRTTSPQLRERLRAARIAAGLTQRDIADHCGISIPYVSQIETGKRDAVVPILEAWLERCGHRLAVVPDALPPADLAHLTDEQAAIVRVIASRIHQLDPVLLATLKMQVAFWFPEPSQPS
ncbi:MAG: helix-turn-helix transcriptional regulator [Deltaproteobacteria bacterium]|jgi:transcriptional regulator with XRE-family HTH domain|nr:helix-turn-helix transcriptional regulator [Deltaproteobacteria bacterium]